MVQTMEQIIDHPVSINKLDGECNDIHPLDFAAVGLGANPNILNHGEAMTVVNKINFEESMNEEMEKCFDNEKYEIVKHSTVPKLKSIRRVV